MTVAVEELKELKSDQVVDARATSCPGPILAAKKAIGGIPVGGVMEVLASDTGTLKDLPAWCKNCLLYTSPSPRDGLLSRMPSSA